jgi:hypothetical protein
MPCWGRIEIEFLGDQRQRDAGHEHDEAFEEFAGDREPPDAKLHAGHRGGRRDRPIGPQRPLVDIGLDRFSAWLRHAGARAYRGDLRDGSVPSMRIS